MKQKSRNLIIKKVKIIIIYKQVEKNFLIIKIDKIIANIL